MPSRSVWSRLGPRRPGDRGSRPLGLGDVPLILSLGHVIPLRDRLALVEALPTILAKHPDTKA